jgi:hypothetical protein
MMLKSILKWHSIDPRLQQRQQWYWLWWITRISKPREKAEHRRKKEDERTGL